ncbi:MAG: DUF4114 domain-containing protein, partial [candidate division Zixibacteria bacterium]|nr:DUF4114 domain-containing protein [candidate division Zixibacteria bacterium]
MRPYRLRNSVLLMVLLAFIIAVPFTSALAGEGDQALMDSLLSAAGTEPTLQEIFDSLGYDIDVVNDELGWEQFCASGEGNVATLLDEISSSYYSASAGWYDADDSTDKAQLFGPSNQANDSIFFTALGEDFVGFYFIPGISGGYTWYTNPAYNRDLFDHAKVYATGQNAAEYLVAFEDLKGGGDQDFNDFIMKVRFA